ncbi:MAG: hypothetical protein AAF636_02280, partial [Pseudomonadota bacterium]
VLIGVVYVSGDGIWSSTSMVQADSAHIATVAKNSERMDGLSFVWRMQQPDGNYRLIAIGPSILSRWHLPYPSKIVVLFIFHVQPRKVWGSFCKFLKVCKVTVS